MPKPVSILMVFIKWLFGKPPKRQAPKALEWTTRILAWVFLAYLFLYGPAARFMPFSLDFTPLSDGKNTVYFQEGHEEKARIMLNTLIEAENDILSFWNEPAEHGFSFGVDLYMCKTKKRYWHLIMNSAPACASTGDVMLDMTFPDSTRLEFLRHELSHLFFWKKLGGLTSRFWAAAWLDEGVATVIQDTTWQDMYELRAQLETSPDLFMPSKTNTALEWLNALYNTGGKPGKQYVFVKLFTRHLIERYGREKVLAYLASGSWGQDPVEAFEKTFGTFLDDEETQYLSSLKSTGQVPLEAEYVDYGLHPIIPAKFYIAPAIVFLLLLWIFRQCCLLLRFVFTWTTRFKRQARPI